MSSDLYFVDGERNITSCSDFFAFNFKTTSLVVSNVKPRVNRYIYNLTGRIHNHTAVSSELPDGVGETGQ